MEWVFSEDNIESIVEIPSTEWKVINGSIPNFGNGKPTVWLKTKIKNNSSELQSYVLELGVSYLDRVEFYLIKENEKIQEKTYGAILKRSETELNHRNPSFDFKIPGQSEVNIYIKAYNSGLLTIPLRLLTEKEFVDKIKGEYLIHGIYFGSIIALFFYNLFIFIITKEKSLLYYCLYIASVIYIYLVLGGFARLFLFPNAPMFIKPGLFFASYMTIFSVLQFTDEFLSLRKSFYTLHLLLKTLAYFGLILAILSLWLPFSWMVKSMNYLLPFGSLLMMLSAGQSVRKNVQQSQFFLYAWVVVTTGIILETLTNLAVLPMEFWIGRFGTQISSLLEIILFAIAIGRRIRVLTLEKEKVNASLLIIQKDLEVARKIQNRILPSKIPELNQITVNVEYHPLGLVGGDFYVFYETSESQLGVFLADVTGHGVSAAMDSSTVKIAFRNERMQALQPKELMKNVNSFLYETIDQRFVSAVYTFFDLNSQRLFYATAGHPPILRIRNGELTFLPSEGFLLGLVPEAQYETFDTEIEPGDVYLLYTDGLNGDINSEESPEDILRNAALACLASPKSEFSRALIHYLRTLRERETDDITLILVRID
ncbi:stage II sporulation protein E [Leptospira ryugenii]|uniref:Stage II sporulation protein E n=1 Tax=Leptospira ryugenii TaxID=1917863 RepID=A0A2P2DWK9_9LEPT|nr:stage II sporulation protein E [Leptospira ryugenii]